MFDVEKSSDVMVFRHEPTISILIGVNLLFFITTNFLYVYISNIVWCVPWNVVKKKENKSYEKECAMRKDKRK